MGNFFVSAIESLGDDEIERMAIESGFQVRAPRKLRSLDMLLMYCTKSVDVSPSFNDIAAGLDDLSGTGPTRQAVGKRVDVKFEAFLKKVLEAAMGRKLRADPGAEWTLGAFNRALVQDSTIIKLPSALFGEYSGVSNAHSKVCNARIQAVYDLRSRTFVSFSIDTYSKNDLLAAPELEIEAGDLTLRDRGYLLSGEMARIKGKEAFFIYRHITGTIYRDPQGGAPIEMERVLAAHGRCDMDVQLDDEAFAALHNVSACQMRAIIMARLIAVTIIMRAVYGCCGGMHAAAPGRRLSLCKLTRYIQAGKGRLTEIIEGVSKGREDTVRKLMRYCAYDKRKKRLNYVEQEEIVFNMLALS